MVNDTEDTHFSAHYALRVKLLVRWKELAGCHEDQSTCYYVAVLTLPGLTGNLQWQQLQYTGSCHTRLVRKKRKVVPVIQLSLCPFLSHLLLLLRVLLQPLPVSLGLLHHLFMGDTWRKYQGSSSMNKAKYHWCSPSRIRCLRRQLTCVFLPTSILLQDPAFELYDGVSEGAAVLALAAVAHLVATHVELAERVQRTHLAVAHIGWPHHVHQAPAVDRHVWSLSNTTADRMKLFTLKKLVSINTPHSVQSEDFLRKMKSQKSTALTCCRQTGVEPWGWSRPLSFLCCVCW